MRQERSYQVFFGIAILFHLLLTFFLFWDKSSERPAMTIEAKNESPMVTNPGVASEQAIQAMTVDSHEVMEAVSQLKAEREQAARVEAERQKSLAMQAEAAHRKRVEEQQQLARLKAESAKLALAQKKKLEEETQRMQQLAKQKEIQQKELQALQEKQFEVKKQKEQEEQSLAAMRAKKAHDELKEKQEKEALAARALEKQEQEQLAMKTAEDAAKKVRIAGVVDRYKALITHAISQQWILPDHADSRLSSQFRIKLAPNGAVLEVSLIRSSGDSILDRSAQSAIYKASPLPVPSDPELFNLFRDISLTVRPQSAQQA
jgi:colicin import membrane protein